MPTDILWSDVSSATLVIAGDSSSPTLKNLSDGNRILSDEIDPAGGPRYGDFRLRCRFDSAPSAGELVQCWFILDVGDDGTYEDGSSSVQPLRSPDFIFAVRNVSTQQIISASLKEGLLPACPYKILLVNNAGQDMTNTDNENQLHYSTYKDQIQN